MGVWVLEHVSNVVELQNRQRFKDVKNKGMRIQHSERRSHFDILNGVSVKISRYHRCHLAVRRWEPDGRLTDDESKPEDT